MSFEVHAFTVVALVAALLVGARLWFTHRGTLCRSAAIAPGRDCRKALALTGQLSASAGRINDDAPDFDNPHRVIRIAVERFQPMMKRY